jgi:hypothetical protein
MDRVTDLRIDGWMDYNIFIHYEMLRCTVKSSRTTGRASEECLCWMVQQISAWSFRCCYDVCHSSRVIFIHQIRTVLVACLLLATCLVEPSIMKMEAVCSFETPVNFYRATLHFIQLNVLIITYVYLLVLNLHLPRSNYNPILAPRIDRR